MSPNAVRAPVFTTSANPRAANDRGAEEHHILRVSFGRSGIIGYVLFGRKRLACQRRLLNVQITSLDQPRVSRNEVSGRKPNQISSVRDRADGLPSSLHP